MMRRLSTLKLAAVAFLAIALLATACSSGSSDTTVAAGATDTTKASSGPDVSSAIVEEIQTTLTDLGYYDGDIDGRYGPQTEAGVKALQAGCNIKQDGIYGPDTHCFLIYPGGDA